MAQDDPELPTPPDGATGDDNDDSKNREGRPDPMVPKAGYTGDDRKYLTGDEQP